MTSSTINTCLPRKRSGLPVALIIEDGEVKVGVMNFIPDANDWFTNPIPLEQWIDKEKEGA